MDQEARKERTRASAETFETTVFRSGNSDAVRLPKRLGLAGRKVRVRATPDGRLTIEPAHGRQWPTGFLASFGRLTGYFHLPAGSAESTSDEERSGPVYREPKRDE